jgi:hypothetical protein
MIARLCNPGYASQQLTCDNQLMKESKKFINHPLAFNKEPFSCTKSCQE